MLTLGRSNVGTIAPGTDMTKSTDTVAGILAGYQFTKYWGAELFYTGAGRFSGQDPAGTDFTSGKGHAWGINAVGTLPLSDTFSLYGKLGLASTKTSVSDNLGTYTGASRTAATYGLGLEYAAIPSVGLRLGWDRYAAAISDATGNTNDFNSNVYSLGAVFKF